MGIILDRFVGNPELKCAGCFHLVKIDDIYCSYCGNCLVGIPDDKMKGMNERLD